MMADVDKSVSNIVVEKRLSKRLTVVYRGQKANGAGFQKSKIEGRNTSRQMVLLKGIDEKRRAISLRHVTGKTKVLNEQSRTERMARSCREKRKSGRRDQEDRRNLKGGTQTGLSHRGSHRGSTGLRQAHCMGFIRSKYSPQCEAANAGPSQEHELQDWKVWSTASLRWWVF